MSLWSGATQYVRVPNTRKEMWMPIDFAVDMELYVWKVKHDPESGRYFFVNLAGFGKRWRLPDIYDTTSQAELKRYVQETGKGRLANLPARGPRAGSGGRSGRSTQSNAKLPQIADSAGVVEVQPPPQVKSSAIEERIKSMSKGAQPQYSGGDEVPQDLAFGYGDGDDWKGMTVTPGKNSGPRESAGDTARRSKIEEEKQLMSQPRPMQQQFGNSPSPAPLQAGARTPPSGTGMLDMGVDVEAFKELQAQEAFVDALYQEKHYESQVREASMQRSAIIFDQQMQQLDERYRHDLEDIDTIEKAHSSKIRMESEGRTYSPSPHNDGQQHPQGGGLNAASPLANYPTPRIMPSSPLEGLVTSSADSVAAAHQQQTVSLALSQVEHERKTNERLMKELDEKDRLLTEYRLSDADREQSMLQLRMQLLDALVANRRKLEMMAEDDGLALPGSYKAHSPSMPRLDGTSPNPTRNQLAGGQSPGSGGRGKSGSYVPPHPLMEDEDGYNF